MKIAALVAAAGASRRMGSPKALLELDGEPIVAGLLRALIDAACFPIVVTVPAPPADVAVRQAVAGFACQAVANAHPALGLSGSVLTALELMTSLPDALLLCPVDMPFVTAELVHALRDGLLARPGALAAVPVVRGQRGHPCLFGAPALHPLARCHLLPEGPRSLLEAGADVVEVAWDDGRVLSNWNEPKDLVPGVRPPVGR
ncbi:MAG: nucleotidyltransferase family protein [Myxococcota bacterium]